LPLSAWSLLLRIPLRALDESAALTCPKGTQSVYMVRTHAAQSVNRL
jgi:hypothetical protein